ncbi:MAG: phosphate acyltransferase PlsX [Rickettsiales bacterium]|jgi:glycerol-3-phosphate acyltransferase PlsX|nr:phosphate acyltransferase PlsX [Rickettsiales bacterium]
MKNSEVTIAIDCLGGDNYPKAQIGGISTFLRRNPDANVRFILFGDGEQLNSGIGEYKIPLGKCTVVHTDRKISSEEKPSVALRQGKGSSMWLAIEAVKQKQADANISAGNTGALMAMSKLLLRSLPDIDRPALIQMLPTIDNGVVALLDMGANIDCNAENLYQFAVMGSIFYGAITGKENPKIGLLNVGSENLKGNDVVKQAAVLLRESSLGDNFYGFIEGGDIFNSVVDVVVTDGFTGNVALKTIEGAAKFLTTNLKEILSGSLLSKLACLLMYRSLKTFKSRIDPEIHNGAMFIGLNGISVKSHGNANEMAFYFSIENTLKLIRNNINTKIISLMSPPMAGGATD